MTSKRVCRSCTTNPHLRDWIASNGDAIERCSYGCQGDDVSVSLVTFARHVDKVIRQNYSPNTDLDDRASHDEDPENVIVTVAGITARLAQRVMAIGGQDDGSPSFYDFRISESAPWPIEHGRAWAALETIVKGRSRFFGKAHLILDALIGDIRTLVAGAAIRQLNSDNLVFRARRENAPDEATGFFKDPTKALTSPPHERATAGRMNAAGIRVFYGALREEIAVAEVRPPVGSRVVVGTFAPTRTLHVLDLGALQWPRTYADIFSAEFEVLSKKLIFLSTLQEEISRPIQPFDEQLEYVPTQVISEYLANVIELDGIAYKSAQTPAETLATGPSSGNRNVALFGSAAMTLAEADQRDVASSGLKFLDGSARMFNVTQVKIAYERDPVAHYEPASADEEE